MSTILYQTAARGSTTDLTTPKCSLVQRKPRGTEGDGHPNQWSMADQGCRREIHEVTLRACDKVGVNERGDEVPSGLGVVLVARIDGPMHVVVLDDVTGHRVGSNMACQEAHDLEIDLLSLTARSKGTT